MTAMRRFLALSGADQVLATEAAAWLVVARLGVMLVRYPTLQRALARCGPQGNSDTRVEKVAWAISVAAVRLPFASSCLVQALAAHAMLRRRGHSPKLRFGVRFGGSGSVRLEAHAWLDLGGVAVIGQPSDVEAFLEMSPPGVG